MDSPDAAINPAQIFERGKGLDEMANIPTSHK
jgi:hypothetical protein